MENMKYTTPKSQQKDAAKSVVEKLVKWHVPHGEVPDGIMLVEVDLASGESDVRLVCIDDDCQTLIEPEYGDVWTDWQWGSVTRYAMLEDILLKPIGVAHEK